MKHSIKSSSKRKIKSNRNHSGLSPASATSIQRVGFIRARPRKIDRVFLGIRGWTNCGKTWLALGAPGPIALINFDKGEAGSVNHYTERGKEIWEIPFSLPPALSPKAIGSELVKQQRVFAGVWDKFAKAYKEACHVCRSVVVDTETELWEIMRYASFGRMSNVAHMFAEVNAIYMGCLREFHEGTANVILLHQMGSNFKTGRPERKGMGKIESVVRHELEVSCENDKEGRVYIAKVTKAGIAGNQVGTQFETLSWSDDPEDNQCRFPVIAAALTNSDKEDWE